MQMSKEDIKNYPKLYQYVSCQIPLVAGVGVIVNAIKQLAGTIERSKITDALKWGKGPMLKVVEMDPYGEFSPGIGSNELRLQKKMVEKFEKGKGLVKTPNGKNVYLVGATILHELTHWADDQDGIDTDGEEGEKFETMIYGGIVTTNAYASQSVHSFGDRGADARVCGSGEPGCPDIHTSSEGIPRNAQ